MSANVLLVEEHTDVRTALRDWLRSVVSPLSLTEARTRKEALRLAEQAKLDFALINVELPGENGIEAARELRRRHHNLPLVLMSVQDSEILRIAAIEAGANAFVPKRDLTMSLLPIVQRLLQKN
jgi:two-component system phosphate regulon response regulator OmpR